MFQHCDFYHSFLQVGDKQSIIICFSKTKENNYLQNLATISLPHPTKKKSREEIPSKHFPLNKTFCSSLNLSIASLDEKLISRDTARLFNIFFGTRAGKQEQRVKRMEINPFSQLFDLSKGRYEGQGYLKHI